MFFKRLGEPVPRAHLFFFSFEIRAEEGDCFLPERCNQRDRADRDRLPDLRFGQQQSELPP